MKLNLERILESAESDEYAGFCRECGNKQYGIEPDARKYQCEKCGELEVCGAEELAMMLAF